MKKVLKFLLGVIVTLYLACAIILTAFLLNYNDYNITVMFDNSLIIVEDELEPYKEGDLLAVKMNDISEIENDDEILFYEVTNGIPSINVGKVTNVEVITDTERTFTINDNHDISSAALIGKTETTTVIQGAGKVLGFLESRFGFLLIIVLPTLILLLYEIYRFIIELKTPLEEEWKNY